MPMLNRPLECLGNLWNLASSHSSRDTMSLCFWQAVETVLTNAWASHHHRQRLVSVFPKHCSKYSGNSAGSETKAIEPPTTPNLLRTFPHETELRLDSQICRGHVKRREHIRLFHARRRHDRESTGNSAEHRQLAVRIDTKPSAPRSPSFVNSEEQLSKLWVDHRFSASHAKLPDLDAIELKQPSSNTNLLGRYVRVHLPPNHVQMLNAPLASRVAAICNSDLICYRILCEADHLIPPKSQGSARTGASTSPG